MSKKYNSSLYFYPNCVVFRQVLKKNTKKFGFSQSTLYICSIITNHETRTI